MDYEKIKKIILLADGLRTLSERATKGSVEVTKSDEIGGQIIWGAQQTNPSRTLFNADDLENPNAAYDIHLAVFILKNAKEIAESMINMALELERFQSAIRKIANAFDGRE